MTEPKPPFREPGEPLGVDARPFPFVSYGVPMVATRTELSDLTDKPSFAKVVLLNCTTTIPMKFDLHDGEIGNTVVIGPSSKGG